MSLKQAGLRRPCWEQEETETGKVVEDRSAESGEVMSSGSGGVQKEGGANCAREQGKVGLLRTCALAVRKSPKVGGVVGRACCAGQELG